MQEMYLKVGKGAVGETKKVARKLSFPINPGNTYSGEENVQRAMKKNFTVLLLS